MARLVLHLESWNRRSREVAAVESVEAEDGPARGDANRGCWAELQSSCHLPALAGSSLLEDGHTSTAVCQLGSELAPCRSGDLHLPREPPEVVRRAIHWSSRADGEAGERAVLKIHECTLEMSVQSPAAPKLEGGIELLSTFESGLEAEA